MKKSHLIVFVSIAVIIIIGSFLYIRSNNNNDNPNNTNTKTDANSPEIIDPASELNSSYSGVVVDGKSQKPLVAKITIAQALPDDNNENKNTDDINNIVDLKDQKIMSVATCNSEGAFDVSVPQGNYRLFASYPGYVTKGRNEQYYSITVEDGDSDEDHFFDLWPEAKIKGHIVSDQRGVPAELAFSYTKDHSGAEDYLFNTIRADQSGNFMLTNAYAGTLSVEITADGFIGEQLSDIKAEPGETVDLGEISLSPGLSLFGTVTSDTKKTAVADTLIQLYDANGKFLKKTTTREDGSYRMPAVPPQKIRIVATSEGYQKYYDSIGPVDQNRYEYNISLTPLAGIELFVNNQTERKPIITTVTVKDIETDKVVYTHEYENGHYILDNLREGPYLVTATSYDKQTEVSARVTAGNSASLTLKPFAKITAEFYHKKNNEPAKGSYRYIYKPAEGAQTTSDWKEFSKESVIIENLKPGSYWIEAKADTVWNKYDKETIANEDKHISRSHEIPLDLGDNRLVKLPLTTGGTIRGKLIIPPELAGKPGLVMVSTNNNSDEGLDFTGSGMMYNIAGEFEHDELPDGNFDITVISFTTDDTSIRSAAANGTLAVSHFSGIHVDEDEDVAMTLDITHSRSQTEDGLSLIPPVFLPRTTDEELAKLTDEEKQERLKELMKTFSDWEKALSDQETWQTSESQKAKAAEINEDDDLDDYFMNE